MLFRSIFVNISNELHISAGGGGGGGGGAKTPPPGFQNLGFTSNPSKAVKSIIWLICLELNYY